MMSIWVMWPRQFSGFEVKSAIYIEIYMRRFLDRGVISHPFRTAFEMDQWQ